MYIEYSVECICPDRCHLNDVPALLALGTSV